MTFGPPGVEGGEVDVVTVDDIMNDSKYSSSRVTFLKADVEGAELLVLKGATRVIAKHEPFIMLEMSEVYLQRFGCTFAEVEGLLRDSGYEAYVLERFSLVPLVDKSQVDSGSVNVMFLTRQHIEHARRVEGYVVAGHTDRT